MKYSACYSQGGSQESDCNTLNIIIVILANSGAHTIFGGRCREKEKIADIFTARPPFQLTPISYIVH